MSIKKRPDGRYDHWYRDPDGHGHKKIWRTLGEAEDHKAEIRQAKRRGTYRPSSGITLRRFAEERWLPHIEAYRRPNTVTTYRSHLGKWVLPKLGGRKLDQIRKADCQEFAGYLAARLAPATVGTAFAVLRSLMKLAVDDELIAASPCTRVAMPEVPERDIERLEPEAVAAIAAAMLPRYEVAVWLAAGAGLREGEVLGLTLPRIDFMRGRIRVVEQWQNRVASPLKTKKSSRIVPVDPMIIDKINGHLALWPAGPGGLLVTNRSGQPGQRNSFGHSWRKAVAAAGLTPGLHIHDRRHFYAISLIEAGNVGPKTIQKRLGHATIGETFDTYGRWFRDDEEQGRGVIEGLLSGQPSRSELTSS